MSLLVIIFGNIIAIQNNYKLVISIYGQLMSNWRRFVFKYILRLEFLWTFAENKDSVVFKLGSTLIKFKLIKNERRNTYD